MSPSPAPAPTPTYAAALKCTNCGNLAVVAVPKGITVLDYANTRTCATCGCKTMRPKWGREE